MKLSKKLWTNLSLLAVMGATSAAVVGCGSSSGSSDIKEDDDNKTPEDQKQDQKVKIGSWNLSNLNYHPYWNTRVDAIAKIIAHANLGILGVQGVKNVNILQKLVEKLQAVSSADKKWELVVSPLTTKTTPTSDAPVTMGNSKDKEYFAFIYDGAIVKTKAFNNDTVGALYDNPWVENEFIDQTQFTTAPYTKSTYVRAPYGVAFTTIDNSKDFTLVTANFDAANKIKKQADGIYFDTKNQDPGQNEVAIKTVETKVTDDKYGAYGSQELFEATQMPKVMSYFDNLNGQDNDLIFLGNTNMRFNKDKTNPFHALIENGYVEGLDPSLASSITAMSTSAKQETSVFSSYNKLAVDKFFNYSPLVVANSAQRYDIISATKIINNTPTIFDTALISSNDKIDYKYIAQRISLHDMIYQELNFAHDQSGASDKAAQDAVARNIDINNASYYELVNTAGFNPKTAYRIVYYRNFVGKISAAIMDNEILPFIGSDGEWIMNQKIATVANSNNVNFIYDTTPQQKNTETVEDNNVYYTYNTRAGIPKFSSLAMDKKIPINAITHTELNAYANKYGILTPQDLKIVVENRIKNTPEATTLNDFGADSKYRKFYEAIFSFDDAPIKIETPYAINSASLEVMLKELTGDKTKPLYPIDVYAIVAYRNQVGKINNYDELVKIISKYKADKMKDLTIYDTQGDLSQDDAMLKQKINFNAIISDKAIGDFVVNKIFKGLSFAHTIKNVIKEIAQKQAEQTPNYDTLAPGTVIKVTGPTSLDDLISKISDSRTVQQLNYQRTHFANLFMFGETNYTIPEKIVQGPLTMAELKKAAQEAPDKNYFINWVIEKIGAENIAKFNKKFLTKDPEASGIGTLSKSKFACLYQALRGEGHASVDPNNIVDFATWIVEAQKIHAYKEADVKKYDFLKHLITNQEGGTYETDINLINS